MKVRLVVVVVGEMASLVEGKGCTVGDRRRPKETEEL
jgi:hypothetical protein